MMVNKTPVFSQRHYKIIVEILNRYNDSNVGINIYNDIADMFDKANPKFKNEIFKKEFLK